MPISSPDTKNALRQICASGPCKYTRWVEIAPSAYASIVSRHIPALPSLLKIGTAIAFIYNRILDCREDVSR